mgnify:CR=1 FL=1
MEPKDAALSFDGAQRSRARVERPGSDVESRWFDVRTAAKYLCMTHACDLPPDQPLPVAIHPRRPQGPVRSRGVGSLDAKGGNVWLYGSAAAFGTSGR